MGDRPLDILCLHTTTNPHTTQHTTTGSRPTQQNTHEQCIIAVREQKPLFEVCVINAVVYVTKSVRWAGNVACVREKRHVCWILVGEVKRWRPFGRYKGR